MTFNELSLPAYPVKNDMWDAIRDEKRNIVVYGMGNGADKLVSRLDRYGVTVSDFFASDGFVRGQVFHGKRVKSFSEIKEEYPDFVILLSFATKREDVLSLIRELDGEYDLYIPDMPVAGEEYFDKTFYNAHYEEIKRACLTLSDDISRATFLSVINYKLTGKLGYLDCIYSSTEEIYSLFDKDRVRCTIDAGAYNGDTAREMLSFFPNISNIMAIEPDPKTYKRLLRFTETEARVTPLNAAVYNEEGSVRFNSGGNRNSSINSTASYETRGVDVPLVTLDSLRLAPDYIKYDVEGAELEAILGADTTIREHKPYQLISLYHRSRDIFFLINLLAEKYPFYNMYLRRLPCVPAWEINLILIPKERGEDKK